MNGTTPRSKWRRRVAVVIAIGAIVVLGAWWLLRTGPVDFAGRDQVPLDAYHGDDPTGAPAPLRNASIIERGAYLARAADCLACHTREGGHDYAGGRAFVLPFGTLYSTNITAESETGIGKYTDAEFLAAVRRGVRRDGQRLYPAMPYPSYTYMTDADVLAIKAYLLSIAPTRAAAPENSLQFPVNHRSLMSVWATLFAADERFAPYTNQSAQWNRGAYLVEALAHCGECHTPRSPFQSLYHRSKFAGAVQAGWRAYNITPDHASGVGDWSEAELAAYLKSGHSDGRGTAAGPMGEAVEMSLQYLTAEDIAAIVAYVRSVPTIASSDLAAPRTTPASDSPIADTTHPMGRRVFEQTCAGCHDWTGMSALSPWATLTGARAVNDAKATNVAQVILFGGGRSPTGSGMTMPAFGPALSDIEIAETANYVVERFGEQHARLSVKDVAAFRKSQ